MPVTELRGDLLKSDCDVLIHCCNCFNTMGAGIARALADRWPGVRAADDKTERGDRSKFGKFTVYSNEKITVYNLYGQYNFGTSKRMVNYEAVLRGLERIAKDLKEKGVYKEVDIGTYKLGCGLAGGNWNIMKPIIEEAFPDKEIMVYTLQVIAWERLGFR